MIDFVKITVKAGKGGSGAVSYQRRKGRPYGPPDGGDGGDGGSVYLEVSKDLTTLLPYRFQKSFKAEGGAHGGKNHKKGKRGEDLSLTVPPGTRVSDPAGRVIADLTKIGERVMVVKGGKGGRGNGHIKKSELRMQNSELRMKKEDWSWFEEGEEGQEIILTLELKLLADVGLIGLPNAGKSTLLSRLTAAHPRIEPYPFTTLEPNLGVMRHKGRELVIADLPGLIEGDSKGRGLGDLFLRHCERTKILVHLVSAELPDPIASIETINKELASYSKDLSDKPQIILLTKIDILNNNEVIYRASQFKKKKMQVLLISSITSEGLEELKDKLIERFKI